MNYFGISFCRTIHSSEMHIPGEKWERVLAIVKNLGGNVYLTGHGARFYLNHEEFEK
ncbi:MAG: WbqC family protein, partial [Dolichospermum sp.]